MTTSAITAARSTRRTFVTEWLLLGGALLVLGTGLLYALIYEYRSIDQHERERLSIQARVINDILGRQLEAIDHALIRVRRELVVDKKAATLAHIDYHLSAFVEAMPGVRTLLVLDADGQVIASSRSELIGRNFNERDYVQTPRRRPDAEMLYVGPPFRTVLGVWSLSLARLIPGAGGEFDGVVVAILDPDAFETLLDSVRYAPDMWSALAHGDGLQFLMIPRRPNQAGKDLNQPGSFFTRHRDSGLQSNVLTGRVYATGEQRLMALRTIRPDRLRMDKALVVAIGRDRRAMYAAWWKETQLFGAVFLLIAAITLPGLHLTQRRRHLASERAAAADAALAESERFMRSLIDIIPGMVGYWTADLRCAFANAAYRDWFGRSPEHMRDIRLQDLLGETLFAKNEPFIRAALAGQAQRFERTLTKADGSTGYTWAHYIPHWADGAVHGFFVLVSDITELKLQEKELARACSAAEAASRAKTDFLANMSHEIRTPMNAVIGLLELMRHTDPSAAQLDYLHKAQGAARSLLSILNDILDFSRVESGRLELEEAPFAVDDWLTQLSVVLSAAPRAPDVALSLERDPTIPAVLRGDALRLQQILLNLGGNAAKFTEHGQILIRLRALDVQADRACIEFSVQDTGIGIPPERLEAIFEGFTQAETSTARRYGGTGLGLAISQRLVRLMGGELRVESRVGQGSCFRFQLDLARDAETQAAERTIRDPRETSTLPSMSTAADAARLTDGLPNADEPARERSLAGLRLLVVEDNALNRQVAHELLTHRGAEVALANDGRQAIALIGSNSPPFDLVLMDLQMPELDGLETTHILRRELSLTELPIIAMTANALPSDRAACLDAGMDDHVGKPFDIRALVETIRHHTGRGSGTTLAGLTQARADGRGREASLAPELEIDHALARLDNERGLFVMLARDFLVEQRDALTQARELAEREEYETLERLLHTLRGMIDTLGATRLARDIREIEAHLHADTPSRFELADSIAALETPYAQIRTCLAQAVDELDSPTDA